MRRKKVARTSMQRARKRRQGRAVGKPRILISFATVSPESAEDGDFSETGWIDEDGVSCVPDEYDRADGKTTTDLAIKLLRDDGATEPSSTHFHKGVWYSDHGDEDYSTGENTTKSYHLHGFSVPQERKIFAAMTKRR